jgi:hypothetical protein
MLPYNNFKNYSPAPGVLRVNFDDYGYKYSVWAIR